MIERPRAEATPAPGEMRKQVRRVGPARTTPIPFPSRAKITSPHEIKSSSFEASPAPPPCNVGSYGTCHLRVKGTFISQR